MLQVERDQMRAGAPLGAAAAAASGPACAARCESTAACLSWVFTRGAATGCQLQSDGPSHIETRPWLFCSALFVNAVGKHCGLCKCTIKRTRTI